MHFVLGLLIQEIVEAWRQGAFIYFSKWWNVVDTVIILTFIGAYGLWLIAWGVYGEWKPEKKFSSMQMAFMPVLASWPIFIWHTFSRSIQRWVPYSCHFTKC